MNVSMFSLAVRRLWLCPLLVCLCGLPPTVFAQSGGSAATTRALLLYDKNRNGVLDPAELAAQAADEAKAAKTPVTTAPAPVEEKAVELSPFQVNADDDRGYLAANTLSGTRLNSKIEDLGASITVITKQQMLDTAAIDINDLFLYEASTEGTGNFTSFTVDRNGGVNDNVQSSPQTANRIRGLDTANTARGNFASNSAIPIDLYNTDGVELSRGPNSSIFGLGNAAGTVNIIPSQANLRRAISTFTLRADSYGGYRTSLDLSRPIFRDKFAIRLSAVYQNTGYERKPSADVTKRLQGSFNYKPFAKTTLRASYESYHNYARRPNAVTPRDSAAYWKSQGSPTWDPTTQKVTVNGVEQPTVYPVTADATLPFGLLAQGSGFYNRPGIYVDGGGIQYWSVNRTGTVPTTGTFNGVPTPDNPNTNLRFLETGTDIQRLRGSTLPLWVTPSITSKSLYDWSSVNFVAPNYLKNKANIITVELEQFLIDTPHNLIAVRAGWYHEDYDSYSSNFLGGANAEVLVDINQKLLNGDKNPYFLRPYIGASEPQFTRSPNLNDIQSSDVAYQLKPSKLPKWFAWIGNQNVALHGETRRIDTATYRYKAFIQDDHPWINQANRFGSTVSRGYYKYYVGDNQGQNVDYGPAAVYSLDGRYNLNWFNALTNQWVAEPATLATGGITPSNRTRREIRTESLATQNFFFDNRIVSTFGWRKDKNRSRDSNGATIDATTGLINYDALKVWVPWVEKAGTTKTAGVVVKPLRWLNAHYNTSDSFLPAVTQYNLYGEVLPNPTGKGKDYGITVALFNQTVVLKINKFTTFQKNSRDGVSGPLATRSIQLDTARVNNGSIAYNFESWATNLANARFTAQGVTPTAAQTSSAVAKIMGLPDGFLDGAIGHSISETNDVAARGLEFELSYNPTRNWTFKANVAQQITIDSNLSPNIQKYIESRLPIWTTATDDAGALWWTTSNGGIPRDFFTGSINAPLKLAVANQNKPRSQVREWRFNSLTNYRFSTGRLKGLGVGGAVRWEDKAAIGYRGGAPDADGIVRVYDPNQPLFDKARYYIDFMSSYDLRFAKDKIRARVQLNIRNVFEKGRLQAIGVNPDGSPHTYRIIDPRQFILSTTFDL